MAERDPLGPTPVSTVTATGQAAGTIGDAVTIVIPVLNECDTLEPLYQRIVAALDPVGRPFEIILINDGSTDGSGGVLDSLAEHDRRVKVIHLQKSYGQTAAMMAGFDHAQGAIVVTLDADLQNEPADIPRLLAALDQGYDVCSGWRQHRQDPFLTRVLLSRIANRLTSFLFGMRLRDHGCTLKAYRRKFLQDLRLYGEMHRFIPVYAAAAGATIIEIPVSHSARSHGRSKYGLGRIVNVILDLILLKFLVSYAHRPVHLFGRLGLLMITASFGVFVMMLYYKFWGDKSFVDTPLPQVVVLLFLMGFLSIMLGLIAEVLMRTYHESQGRPWYRIRERRNLPEAD